MQLKCEVNDHVSNRIGCGLVPVVSEPNWERVRLRGLQVCVQYQFVEGNSLNAVKSYVHRKKFKISHEH